jgi:hypothetical protein
MEERKVKSILLTFLAAGLITMAVMLPLHFWLSPWIDKYEGWMIGIGSGMTFQLLRYLHAKRLRKD